MTIPTPLEVLNELNKLFYNYICGKKTWKISQQQICRPEQMEDWRWSTCSTLKKSMKIKWLKQFFTGFRKNWLHLLLNETNFNMSKFSSLGSQWISSAMPQLNPFWKTVFLSYDDFCKQIKIKTTNDVLCTSLWCNNILGTSKSLFPDWYYHGIHIIADIVSPEGIMTMRK